MYGTDSNIGQERLSSSGNKCLSSEPFMFSLFWSDDDEVESVSCWHPWLESNINTKMENNRYKHSEFFQLVLFHHFTEALYIIYNNANGSVVAPCPPITGSHLASGHLRAISSLLIPLSCHVRVVCRQVSVPNETRSSVSSGVIIY